VPAGFKPLLVMDVREHAYMRDYKAPERGQYIQAFFRNIDWSVVEGPLQDEPPTRCLTAGHTVRPSWCRRGDAVTGNVDPASAEWADFLSASRPSRLGTQLAYETSR
jgi:iron/manganese superoxide dismutase-like protein